MEEQTAVNDRFRVNHPGLFAAMSEDFKEIEIQCERACQMIGLRSVIQMNYMITPILDLLNTYATSF